MPYHAKNTMEKQVTEDTDKTYGFHARSSLRRSIDDAIEKCIRCDLCMKECAFIQKYGKPKDIAESYDPSTTISLTMPFECSLCGLCTAVCPSGLDPTVMLLEMRRETVRRGEGDYPEHEPLRAYERRGASRKYSYYALPSGCNTVLFPGCSLSGTRSQRVIDAYLYIRKAVPNLGIVLDCCTKPSHDLGRESHFNLMFDEMRRYLLDQGIRKVLAACPNCYRIFKNYGNGLVVESIYETIAKIASGREQRLDRKVRLHDPCVARFEEPIISSARQMTTSVCGLTIEEMPHSKTNTYCCGEGAGVSFVAPDFASMWGQARQKEAAGQLIVTSCAGCANVLSKLNPAAHILDVFFEPERALAGEAAISKPPFTYWKRQQLKKWIKRNVPSAVSRERTFIGEDQRKGRGMIKLTVFLVFILAVIAVGKLTGASRLLERNTLSAWMEGYGALAPLIYMLTYAVAPMLFLPGLPITMAGGILFGPFWGVVYTITGSTIGACLAFLVSRYLARGWVEQQLKGPRWRRLDQGVEKHGWKVVAFTRLIPLFPFNLLNYAFGLTKIRFAQYAAATFLCMLPACIAFIVFSSSLLDLVRGKISSSLIIGITLIALVSIFPLLYRRYKARRGEEEPL